MVKGPQEFEEAVTCRVEPSGHLCLQLRAGVVLDISPGLALRLRNPLHESSVCLSSCSSHLALLHPVGRLLQYGPRLEVQVDDKTSVKNAKFHPKGISFTANNCALVYLLDEAGARSTMDMFHDLQASNIVDDLFLAWARGGEEAIRLGVQMMEEIQHWRDGEDHWHLPGLSVSQTLDGLVSVTKEQQGERVTLKVSPNNGKVKVVSRSLLATASLGQDSHMFLRDGDRRLHYSAQSSVFTVRNAGHSAGFDEEGVLNIF